MGEIEAIYVDRSSRQPEWALVQTGLFGGARTFVSLAGAVQLGDTVQVLHETSVVRQAPRLEEDATLSDEDEARLYAHYGIPYTIEESASSLSAGENASTDATTELPPSSRLEVDAPAAAGLSAAVGSPRATRTATRKAVQAGQQVATSGRLAVHKARQEVARPWSTRSRRRRSPSVRPASGPWPRPPRRSGRWLGSWRRLGAGSGSPMPASAARGVGWAVGPSVRVPHSPGRPPVAARYRRYSQAAHRLVEQGTTGWLDGPNGVLADPAEPILVVTSRSPMLAC